MTRYTEYNFLAALALFSLAGVVRVFAHFADKRRSRVLQLAVRNLGYGVQRRFGPGEERRLSEELPLFSRGRSKTIGFAFRGHSSSFHTTVMSLRYVTGSSRHPDVHEHWVLLVEQMKRRLPEFAIAPMNPRDNSVGGPDDIDFRDLPEFAALYRVSGRDAPAIRHELKRQTAVLLTDMTGWHVETRGTSLAVFHDGLPTDPSEVRVYVDEAMRIVQSLTAR